jgi:hypothetical protein
MMMQDANLYATEMEREREKRRRILNEIIRKKNTSEFGSIVHLNLEKERKEIYGIVLSVRKK